MPVNNAAVYIKMLSLIHWNNFIFVINSVVSINVKMIACGIISCLCYSVGKTGPFSGQEMVDPRHKAAIEDHKSVTDPFSGIRIM